MKLSYTDPQSGMIADCKSPILNENGIGTFHIQAAVDPECRIGAASTLDFGTVGAVLSSDIDVVSTIEVPCNGSSYHVWLSDGMNFNGTARPGACVCLVGGFILYELYRDAARTQRLGQRCYGLARVAYSRWRRSALCAYSTRHA